MKQVGETLDLSFEVKVVRGAGAAPEVMRFGDLVTGPTVVSVYMRNNTGSCDKQNAALVADLAAIRERGYAVIAVSRDTAGSHERYATKLGIDYSLVSDPEDLFGQAADAIVEKKMYGRTFTGPLRSAWVLDGTGKVLAVIDKVDAKAHGAQVLSALDGI
ncbi:redoxin domain-containing protein [Actomonas aquatica]|uniref:thioredoxin-dependent peroxiredoxin n=1 Tax=Actomonas aquatica TaxID=2866162 RepID=A0ABZ1C5T6_9BACT|nr:redoxin domain-containing protein [Opitutus sp. WL0086]WRQ86959.1 redoxin domain-containing protein [Opitutus sp. WL0086]